MYIDIYLHSLALSLSLSPHTHTHTHTYTHARTHARKHARTHAHTHTHTYIHTHTHTYAHTHIAQFNNLSVASMFVSASAFVFIMCICAPAEYSVSQRLRASQHPHQHSKCQILPLLYIITTETFWYAAYMHVSRCHIKHMRSGTRYRCRTGIPHSARAVTIDVLLSVNLDNKGAP
jgi:hypothetical protein